MCVGCMSSAEFVVASGAVTFGAVRVGLRALLPETPSFLRKVSDDEAAAFLASYAPPADRAPRVDA
jgi:hypothetical protein